MKNDDHQDFNVNDDNDQHTGRLKTITFWIAEWSKINWDKEHSVFVFVFEAFHASNM